MKIPNLQIEINKKSSAEVVSYGWNSVGCKGQINKGLIFWIPKKRNYSDQFVLYSQIHCQRNFSRQISREEQWKEYNV